MKTYGLAGFPLSHSFSKKYFEEKFRNEKLDECVYLNFESEDINELIIRIRKNREIVGMNVTIPFKEKVLRFLDDVDETAMEIGAVNTIKITRNGNETILVGYNTDYIGFEKSIKPLLKPFHKSALVLGTGGASNAVVYVLQKMEIEFIRVSRFKMKHVLQYHELTPELIKEHTVIINCTPSGMYPSVESFPEIPYLNISSRHLLYDLIYNPEETVFLKKGKDFGAVAKNGYEMLSIQADESWRIWNATN